MKSRIGRSAETTAIPSYPSTEEVLLFATYLILIGSILTFAIYEFVAGVAFQVLLLVLGGVGFAFLMVYNFIAVPQTFVSFIQFFSIPLITDTVLVLIYMGTGLKLGLDAKQLRGSGLRVAAGGIIMAVVDIVSSAVVFAYVCQLLLGWPWALGALFGSIVGETSAAVVVPYLNHITNLSAERASKTEHLTKLTSVIKLESTMNSIVLLLMVAIFYNQIFIGNNSPTIPVFLQTTASALSSVIDYHLVVLVFALAGIPIIVYMSSRTIVFFVKRRLSGGSKSGIEPYAVLYLRKPFPTSTEDIEIRRSSDVTEFSEKQMRMGMILYGIVLGIGLLVFEEMLKLTSFAGFANALFALIALIYLGFFIGYLFPGGGRKSYESDSSLQGKRTFTGMMLFHDEIELLIRIVFYFSIGIELGLMLFSPPQGLPPIPPNEVKGAIELILLMVPIFVGLRYLSGMFGLPLAFYSRKNKESFRKDFKLVGATMPRGVTVAAISVLLLQTQISSSGTIYVLALTSIVVSTFAFTLASRAGSSVLKGQHRQTKKTANIALPAAAPAVKSEDTMSSTPAGESQPNSNVIILDSAQEKEADGPGRRDGPGISLVSVGGAEELGKNRLNFTGATEETMVAVSMHPSSSEHNADPARDGLKNLEEKIVGIEDRLFELRKKIGAGVAQKEIVGGAVERKAKSPDLANLEQVKNGIMRLNASLETLYGRVEALSSEVSVRNELRTSIEDIRSDMEDQIFAVKKEVKSLTDRLVLKNELDNRLQAMSSDISDRVSTRVAELLNRGPSTTAARQEATPKAVASAAEPAGMKVRRVTAMDNAGADRTAQSKVAFGMAGGMVMKKKRHNAAATASMLLGLALYAGAFISYSNTNISGGYILIIPGSVMIALGLSLLLRKSKPA